MATTRSVQTKRQAIEDLISAPKANYWIPTDPLTEKRLIRVLAKMVKYYLETHPKEGEIGEGILASSQSYQESSLKLRDQNGGLLKPSQETKTAH